MLSGGSEKLVKKQNYDRHASFTHTRPHNEHTKSKALTTNKACFLACKDSKLGAHVSDLAFVLPYGATAWSNSKQAPLGEPQPPGRKTGSLPRLFPPNTATTQIHAAEGGHIHIHPRKQISFVLARLTPEPEAAGIDPSPPPWSPPPCEPGGAPALIWNPMSLGRVATRGKEGTKTQNVKHQLSTRILVCTTWVHIVHSARATREHLNYHSGLENTWRVTSIILPGWSCESVLWRSQTASQPQERARKEMTRRRQGDNQGPRRDTMSCHDMSCHVKQSSLA